jgi:large repetitive protein
LNRASRETADVSATVQINKLGSAVLVLGRKIKADDYRAVIKLNNRGALSVWIASRQASETVPLSNTVSLIGRYQRGEEIKIKMQVFGVNPTVIRAKVWRAAEVEPQAWSVAAQDGFDRLQRSGVIGIAASRPGGAPGRVRLSVLDFVARPVIG